jgi:protein-S-isoprenylcysteine O-methyltransferase Ste14
MTPNAKSPTQPPAAWHGRRGELLVAVQLVLLAAFVLSPPWNPWLPGELLDWTRVPRIAAFGLLGVGALAMAALGAMQLRRFLTPLPYPVDHSELVTSGIYGLVRHPLYGSQLIAALGWTLYTLSLLHLALLVLGFLFFDYKASKEEAWLTERHRDYPAYARRVRKLIPWVY